MSCNDCPPLHIELLNPTQPAPSPGELETFPRITLSQEGIVNMRKLHKQLPGGDNCVERRIRAKRNRARLSRFRTQPITFAEIAEVDEDREEAAASSSKEPPR
ncbi:unnamed protein product [Mesocestoides corti]|nr:unnamed protein product [Mesocestoides corti]